MKNGYRVKYEGMVRKKKGIVHRKWLIGIFLMMLGLAAYPILLNTYDNLKNALVTETEGSTFAAWGELMRDLSGGKKVADALYVFCFRVLYG